MQAADSTLSQEALKGLSLLRHLRANRLEYLLVLMMVHSLGLLDGLLAHAQGVCA